MMNFRYNVISGFVAAFSVVTIVVAIYTSSYFWAIVSAFLSVISVGLMVVVNRAEQVGSLYFNAKLERFGHNAKPLRDRLERHHWARNRDIARLKVIAEYPDLVVFENDEFRVGNCRAIDYKYDWYTGDIEFTSDEDRVMIELEFAGEDNAR